jgi:hypothetical protein
VVSVYVQTQGKPTILQKRKHQIHYLAWEAQQRELELIERRAQGYASFHPSDY